MKNPRQVALGALFMLAGLWGGALFLDLYKDTWMGFPTFATSCGVGVLGVVCIIFGSTPK